MALLGTNPKLPESTQDLKWFKGNLRPLPIYGFTNQDPPNNLVETYIAEGYDFLVLPQDVYEAKPFENISLRFFPFTQVINDDEFDFELNAINILIPDNMPHHEYYYELLEEYIDTIKEEGNDNVSFVNAGIFKSEDFYWVIKDSNVKFIELYNGYPEESKVDRHFNDIEDVWDMMNAERCREGRQLIYGIVNEKRLLSDGGHGYIMVHAKSTNPADLFEAINAGRFYNSTGVVLEEIRYMNHKWGDKLFPSVYVKIKPEPGLTYKIEVIKIGEAGNLISSVENKTETWDMVEAFVESTTSYSRIKVTSSKIISYVEGVPQFETAWTQPYIFH